MPIYVNCYYTYVMLMVLLERDCYEDSKYVHPDSLNPIGVCSKFPDTRLTRVYLHAIWVIARTS